MIIFAHEGRSIAGELQCAKSTQPLEARVMPPKGLSVSENERIRRHSTAPDEIYEAAPHKTNHASRVD
jgi:hypothetical protein